MFLKQSVWLSIETFDEGTDVDISTFKTKISALTDAITRMRDKGWDEGFIEILKDKNEVWNGNELIRVQGKIILDNLSKNDELLVKSTHCLPNERTMNNTEAIIIEDYLFLLSKEDFKSLTDTHKETLETLVDSKVDLNNPIYTAIDKDGTLIVD